MNLFQFTEHMQNSLETLHPCRMKSRGLTWYSKTFMSSLCVLFLKCHPSYQPHLALPAPQIPLELSPLFPEHTASSGWNVHLDISSGPVRFLSWPSPENVFLTLPSLSRLFASFILPFTDTLFHILHFWPCNTMMWSSWTLSC